MAPSPSDTTTQESFLLDVRTPAEFATGAVTGARNIEYQNVSHFLTQTCQARKDAEITLYCRSGRRSALAKDELTGLGFTRVRDLGTLENAKSFLETEARIGGDRPREPAVEIGEEEGRRMKEEFGALLKGLRAIEEDSKRGG